MAAESPPAAHVLAPGLLAGRSLAITPPGAAPGIASRLGDLGAELVGADDGPPGGLLHDARPAFGEGGREGLRLATDACWSAVRAVVAERMIPAGIAGPVVLLGPAPPVGEHARALQGGLESLARTLSVEWARHGINTVALLPRRELPEWELAELAALLLSPAGGYLSGCVVSPG